MSEWLQNAITKAQKRSDWLMPKRAAALAALQQRTWPNRKTEDWKYTSVKAIEKLSLDAEAPVADVRATPISGLNAIELVFVNGQLQTLPNDLPSGLILSSLNKLNSEQQDWARELFASCKPERHLFGLVNDVLSDNGVLIDVLPSETISQPIRIVNITTSAEVHHRVLVRIGAGAKLTVMEEASGNETGLLSAYGEYYLAEKSELEYYRFSLRTSSALTVAGSHFSLSSEAKLNGHVVGFGSELSRLDIDVMHRGENAHAKLNAIYLLDGEENFDLHSTIEHEIGHCVTDENVRGIVGGSATAVFNGRIHIHRDAQKTLAELNNKNLLLSDDATINTKPELEIYADDVRCAHGATVAELDQSALYYMMSRGVQKEKALIMLNFGFINALVDEMPNSEIAEWLRPQLQHRFAAMTVE